MRPIENWIWLPRERYPESQTTYYHVEAVPESKWEECGHYTVAEFTRTYSFGKKVTRADLRFSGDTEFDLSFNGEVVATGPANIGGDFHENHIQRKQHYASSLTLEPNCEKLDFYARVKMRPIVGNEYSKGHGGFMLTGHLTFEDGSIALITTDKTWLVRRNGRYVKPYVYDMTVEPGQYIPAEETDNIWLSEDSEIPLRAEELIYPENGGKLTAAAGEVTEAVFTFPRVRGAFLHLSVKTQGTVRVTVNVFELQVENSREEFVFTESAEYRGLQLHSVGGYRVTVENLSGSPAEVRVGTIATCYPAPECAAVVTSDVKLNGVLDLCRQALKYCRQSIHLDSTKHCEPLACTGDYYIETLMTAFSFGDMRLAEFDIRRTAELLRYHDGRMFHTSYSLIWVRMVYDTYMLTGNVSLLEDSLDALYLLLRRFETYLNSEGIIESSPDYLFVDWINIDGYSLHHPPKNLGQSCLNMFYHMALVYAAKIYAELGLTAMAGGCAEKAERLRTAIDKVLYSEEIGLYCEGMTTQTPEEELNISLPQSNGKLYYRKHANILAVYCGVADGERAERLIRRVLSDDSLGGCQPYFMHYLLEAVYDLGLREEYTMQILEAWKIAYDECSKGLPEGFIKPENYIFDRSHAWAGTPLYSLPKALIGFECVEPGFKRIRLSPALMGLESATVEMLTPYGRLRVYQDGDAVSYDVPDEIVLEVI